MINNKLLIHTNFYKSDIMESKLKRAMPHPYKCALHGVPTSEAILKSAWAATDRATKYNINIRPLLEVQNKLILTNDMFNGVVIELTKDSCADLENLFIAIIAV